MSKKLFGKFFIFLLVVGLLFAAAPTKQAQAATITVCNTGGPCDYTTIQAAINAATAGDTITVAAGTYIEDVVVNKAITLQGAGMETTTIVATTGNTNPLTFNTSNATVSGFHITHNYTPAELDAWNFNNNGVTFYQNTTGNTLANCKVTKSRNGIYINNARGNVLNRNTIENNRTGINITNYVDNTQILNNIIQNNWTIGIVYYQGSATLPTNFSTVTVTGNTFSNNWYSEILLKDNGSVVSTDTGVLNVTDNTFSDSPVTYSTSSDASLNEPGFAGLKPVEFGGTATMPTTPLPTLRIYNVPGVTLQKDGKTLVVGAAPNYTTIQAAIDAAAAGDTILVYPGAYDETASGRTLDNGGTYQFGLFFDSAKPGIILQGVKADGTPITVAADVVASIKTNATNSFGYSGVFVEADNITITGLEFLDNYVGGAVDNNKTLEVIGNNFTFKDNIMSVTGGGSLYLNDWSYNDTTKTSHFESYNISENLFKFGASVDISSGVGVSGSAVSRVISNNVFTADGEDVYWANISFNGTIPSIGWFVYPVGGATISGNTFTGGDMPIRSRGIVEDDFDWPSYVTGNNFDKAVIAWDTDNNKPRAYDYTSGSYTLNNVMLIGNVIQDEIGHAQPGDEVRVIKGTFNEAVNVNKAVTIVGTGEIETFTDPITIGATQAPETWYTDRYAPGVFENSTLLGESVLHQGIRAADFQASNFYNTQGRKYDIGLTGPTQMVSIDMFVGEDWGTNTRYAGLWATGFDAANEVSSYPIVAWRNAEGDGPGFFAYNVVTGAWIKLRDAVPSDYGKWHTLEMELTAGVGIKHYIDGEMLLDFPHTETVSLGNVILNAKNYNADYDVYWDNFAAHDTKVIGQLSINASDVAIKGLILSNPGQPYGMLIDDAVSNIGITENIFEDIGSPTLSQNVKGVYLQYGPDNVLIQNNLFERIHANTNSVNAIFSGDSNSTSPAEGLHIQDNRFLNISSQTKGGYGILLNNGAGNPGAIIDGNRFSGISGGWTHAIGLEGPTPNALVNRNTFSGLTAGSVDNTAVFFEANTGLATTLITNNQFLNVGFGVAVHPDMGTHAMVLASPNWWGQLTGPAAGQLPPTGAYDSSPWCANAECTEFLPATIYLPLIYK